MKTAFVFSGQGAQAPGMGKELYESFPVCKEYFQRADEALGFGLSKLCFEGGEELDLTEYAQPAILTMSAACLALLRENGVAADFVAGLSLGEYTALYAAGVFSFEDAVKLVRKRGELMANAAPAGFGAMSAILGGDRELVEKACADASQGESRAYPANFNCPGQIVISGEKSAVERAAELCAAYGAKRAIPLNVSGPFHTPYLSAAAKALTEELEKTTLQPFTIPVISNTTGRPIPSFEDIVPTLEKQMISPVKWEDSIAYLLSLGVDTFVELGPGKALCGFIKKMTKEASILNIEDIRSYENTMEAFTTQ